MKKATQKGIGTIDTYESHGKMLFRFVPKAPNKEKLRLVKMHYIRMGFKKGYPEEMKTFFQKAMDDKKEVEIECEFFDKGPGRATSIGIKLISYKYVKK
ncbi:MAG: hypothetical protein NE330_15730 [Lentisphaeraceae bacterium]|nr:hypothetical protein [Lentisphaeraceae bacterium]